MNKKLLILLYSFLSSIFITSCKDSTTGSNNQEAREASMHVHVALANGNPLSDVGILFYDDFGLFGGNLVK